MFDVIKRSAQRVDIELSGEIDADAMRKGLDALIEASEGVSRGRMLYRLSQFEMPTLGAFAVEFARLPRLFQMLGRYDKCAVLCETAWIRTAAEIEGKLIPGLEIRSFTYAEADAAEAWLAEGS